MKYKSRASGQGACLKRMSRTIIMQGFTLTTITATEKYTLVLDSTQLDVNFYKVDGP